MANNGAFGKKKPIVQRMLQRSVIESVRAAQSIGSRSANTRETPQEYTTAQFEQAAGRLERVMTTTTADTVAAHTKEQMARRAQTAYRRKRTMPHEDYATMTRVGPLAFCSKPDGFDDEPCIMTRAEPSKSDARHTELIKKEILIRKAAPKDEPYSTVSPIGGITPQAQPYSARLENPVQSAVPDTAMRKNLLKKYRRDQLRRAAVTNRLSGRSAAAVRGAAFSAPVRTLPAVKHKAAATAHKGAQGVFHAIRVVAEKAAALAAKAVSVLVSALVPLIGAAGVVVLCVLFIGVIAVIVASPLGILFSEDTGDASTISVSSVIQETNLEFTGELSRIILANPNVDETNITYIYEDDRVWTSFWPEIIALFAVEANMSDEIDVIVIDAGKAQRIKDTFWDMHQISYEIVQVADTENPDVVYDHLNISVRGRTLNEMATLYHFTANEVDVLHSLLSAEFRSALDSICNLTNTAGTLLWPLPGYHTVTTNFGEVDAYGNPGHKGIDISAPENTPILAAHGGSVIFSYFSESYGNVVMLDDGNDTTTLCAHMISRAVSIGDTIDAGDMVGYVGSTGWSTGNHLHFEVRVGGILVDPMSCYL